MHHPINRITHTPALVTPAQWAHHGGLIRRPIRPRADVLPRSCSSLSGPIYKPGQGKININKNNYILLSDIKFHCLLFCFVCGFLLLYAARRLLVAERPLMDQSIMMDTLRYFSVQPILHNWCNEGRDICCAVSGVVFIIFEPLRRIYSVFGFMFGIIRILLK